MVGRQHELSHADEAMAPCLPRGITRRKSAKVCDVFERTTSHRLADATVRTWVEELRLDWVGGPVGELATVGDGGDWVEFTPRVSPR